MNMRGSLAGSKNGIPVGAPGAPLEGADAGDADDLRQEYINKRIRSYRTRARQLFTQAQRILQQNRQAAEKAAREALECAAGAFWWAEGTDDEAREHQLLHQIGRWTRRTFGCNLHYDGDSYHQRCPVAMAHIRAGYSIGQIGLLECSICGNDLSECPHIRNRSYWVRGGSTNGQPCRVCMGKACNHRDNRLYRTAVIGISKPTHIPEVSLVDRPANPECHLRGMQISPRSFVKELGPAFLPGMPISCDQCLNQCPGFTSLCDTDVPEPISPNDRV
jgi:hypothetical protein